MLDGTKGDTIFRSITAGSVAADSAEAHECVGMILEKVDGHLVTTNEDMQRAMAKNAIVLHFRQPAQGGSGSGAAAVVARLKVRSHLAD